MLRRPIQRIPLYVGLLEVAGIVRKRAFMIFRMRNKRISTIMGHIEPFMPVCCPGVGMLNTGCEVLIFSTCSSPKTKSAVYVHPCMILMSDGNELLKRVKHPGVYIAGLHQDYGRSIWRISQLCFESFCR